MRTPAIFFISLLLGSLIASDTTTSSKRVVKRRKISSEDSTSSSIESTVDTSRKRSNSLHDDSLLNTPLLFNFKDSIFEEAESVMITSAPPPSPSISSASNSASAFDVVSAVYKIIITREFGKLASLSVDPSTAKQLCLPRAYRAVKAMTLMHLAAYYDHDEAIHWLFKQGCTPNIFMSSGCTPLQVACGRQCPKAAKALLSLPVINPYSSSVHGRTSLMSAVHRGNLEIINAFLERTNFNTWKLLNAHDSDGTSILEWAHVGNCKINADGSMAKSETHTINQLYSGANDAIITRLLDFAHLIVPDPEFLARLFVLDRTRFYRLAVAFPANTFRAVKLVDVDLLKRAILDEQINTLRALHSANVVNPNAFDSHGILPVHFAATHNRQQSVMFYLKELGLPVDVKSRFGVSVIEYARANRHEDLVNMIELIEIINNTDIDAVADNNDPK